MKMLRRTALQNGGTGMEVVEVDEEVPGCLELIVPADYITGLFMRPFNGWEMDVHTLAVIVGAAIENRVDGEFTRIRGANFEIGRLENYVAWINRNKGMRLMPYPVSKLEAIAVVAEQVIELLNTIYRSDPAEVEAEVQRAAAEKLATEKDLLAFKVSATFLGLVLLALALVIVYMVFVNQVTSIGR